MSRSLMISGEDVETLVRFFSYHEMGKEQNVPVSVSADNVPPEVATPLLRAIMRREARLLTEDADAMEDFKEERGLRRSVGSTLS